MEVKTSYTYNFEDSCKRIDDMLATSGDFEETVDIKKRVNLTYDNGYYVNCYALFVDIRDSSSLPSVHQKRVLAKLYRSYISEVTAIMQSNTNCKEVNIIGDCVSGIFTCSSKDDVMEPFSAAYTINGIVQVLNLKASKKGYHPIKIGIGIAKGKALMVQNGNGVMNVSAEVYTDLAGMLGYQNKPYQEMLNKPYDKNYYTGNIILHSIEEWLDENR